MKKELSRRPWRAVPTALLLTAATGLLLPARAAQADVEALTIRLEEARCLS